MNGNGEGNETIDPGTQPSAVGDPLERPIVAPQFDFPLGLRGESDQGPYGAKPGTAPQWSRPPYLGQAFSPGALRTITLQVTPAASPTWQRVPVSRPTVIIPYSVTGFPAGSIQLECSYLPAQALTSLIPGGTHALMSSRGACYLWSPGDWRVALGPNGPAGSTVDFVMIPAEDRSVAEALLRPWEHGTRGMLRESAVTLAAATTTTLLELSTVLFRDFIRVSNVGANPVSVDFGSQGATINGTPIAAGTYADFFGRSLPMARLQARSTLGTDVTVLTSQRSFNA
jgi:hypothetical protein